MAVGLSKSAMKLQNPHKLNGKRNISTGNSGRNGVEGMRKCKNLPNMSKRAGGNEKRKDSALEMWYTKGVKGGFPMEQQNKLLRHRFSLIGWGLLVYLLVDQISASLVMLLPFLQRSLMLQMAAGYAVRYTLSPLVLWLFIRSLPKGRGPGLRISGRSFLRTFVFCVGVMYAFNLFTVMLTALVELVTGTSTGNLLESMADTLPMWFFAVLSCVVAPVLEELVYRKLLLDRLRPFGDAVAIGVSGVAFGLFHVNLYQFFYAAALGMVLAAVVVKTGKIWHSMLLHAMINTCSTAVDALSGVNEVFYYLVLAFILTVLAASVYILVRWRRTYYMAPPAWPLTTRQVCSALTHSVGAWVYVVLTLAASVAVIFLMG